LKIRIFALAKELDLDSKLLIEYCAKCGVQAKNVLASISPEERDQVVAFIRQQPRGGGAPPEAKSAVLTRDDVAIDVAKPTRPIRNMNTMVARPQPGRLRPAEPVSSEPPVEEPPVAEELAVVEAPEPEVAEESTVPPTIVVEAPSTDVPLIPAVEAPPVQDEPPSPPPTGPAPAPALAQPSAPTRPAGFTRDDYVSATGAAGKARPIRTMTSRGTSDTSGTRQLEKPSKKGGVQIAAIPEFKGPVAKAAKPEEKAQKPEIKLTPAEIRSNSPLAGHIKKNAEKAKKLVDDGAADAGKKDVGRGKGIDRLAGMGLEGSRQGRKKRVPAGGEDDESRSLFRGPKRRTAQRGSTQFKSAAEVELPITVRTLSEAMGRPAKQLMQVLFERGDMVTINTALTDDEAQEIAFELGVELTIKKEKDVEDELNEIFTEADPPETLVTRPPIVTILGHVDHGKTTLVDKIRSANVAASEFGGITQHIAAYQVEHNGHKITFVDTPGHAAFGEMRARGANVTDIVVLVVAANDGVMPQTIECIAHARAAGVPLVVAMNKIDLPDVNEQRVLQDLAAQNVLAAEWGGDIEVVRTSGLTGKGVSDLLDTILLTAELHELKANPDRPACGLCLEAFRDEHRGPLAWLIDQKGTLEVGDVILCGAAYGRVRAMYNERDEEIAQAPPSTPFKVAGLDIVPKAGDRFLAVDDMDLVREIAETRRQQGRAEQLASRTSKRTLEDILNRAKDGQVQDLFLVVKADTPGSMEALKHELAKFEHPEVRVKVIHDGIGGVNESDVYLASASNAVIVAFHVIPEDRAEQLAQQEGVDIRRYNIIYEVIDDIRNTLEGMLKPEQREVVTGRAIVLRIFNISRFGTIAGCRVLNGTIERSHRIHLIREQKILNAYGIGSLRREKDDAKEVREGMECGIRLEGFNDVKEGDLFEAYRIEEVRRTLD
jgi:translation initiation factor IF-2